MLLRPSAPPPLCTDAWVRFPQPNPLARLRLFCFPHAGGGASLYRLWPQGLPEEVEVCAVQLPGREGRMQEAPFTRMTPLVQTLLPALQPYLDKPFALFGHSLGALICFQLARQLRRQVGLLPVHLFVAAWPAPHLPHLDQPLHQLPEAEFIRSLRRLQGTPELVLRNRDLLDIFLPLLRADFAVAETYTYAAEPPLACPITAFGGLQDRRVGRQPLEAWRQQTTAAFALRLFPGDHFFVQDNRPLLLEAIAGDLTRCAEVPPCPPAPLPLCSPAPLPLASQMWHVPPADLTLGDDEIHVWRVHLALTAGDILALRRTLAADELARAKRFHFQEDRQRFIAARGALRDILGRYLQRPPQEVRFRYSAHGKPLLAAAHAQEDPADPHLQFNLAHAGDLALVAVARRRPVGVDIERFRPDISQELLAARTFSPREQAQLQALPAGLQTQGFFNCWTRKEAYVKARGEGLSLPLDQFDVSLAPGEPAQLLHVAGDPQEAARWTLMELAPGPDHAAALAVPGHGWRLTCWQWQPHWRTQ